MSVGNVDSEARGSGARFNDGKVPLHLVPLCALEDCARVFDYGRLKYSEWNWAKGMDWSVPYDSLLRHLAAWFRGEDVDPESGLPHLGHAMCNMVMLSTFSQTYREGDDRPKQWLNMDPASALDLVEDRPVIFHAIDAPMPPFDTELPPNIEALMDRGDEDAPTEGLKAGEALNPVSQADEE